GAGALTGLAGDMILKSGPRYTLAEIVERTGLSPDFVRELDLAVGLPVAGDERGFTEERVQLYGFFRESAGVFAWEPGLRCVRSIGSSVARISEGAVSLFYVNVEGPMRQQGTTERALAEVSARAVETIGGLQVMIQGLFRSHMEVAIQRFRLLRLGS